GGAGGQRQRDSGASDSFLRERGTIIERRQSRAHRDTAGALFALGSPRHFQPTQSGLGGHVFPRILGTRPVAVVAGYVCSSRVLVLSVSWGAAGLGSGRSFRPAVAGRPMVGPAVLGPGGCDRAARRQVMGPGSGNRRLSVLRGQLRPAATVSMVHSGDERWRR